MPKRCQEEVWNGGGGDRGRREEGGRSTPGATTSPSLLAPPSSSNPDQQMQTYLAPAQDVGNPRHLVNKHGCSRMMLWW